MSRPKRLRNAAPGLPSDPFPHQYFPKLFQSCPWILSLALCTLIQNNFITAENNVEAEIPTCSMQLLRNTVSMTKKTQARRFKKCTLGYGKRKRSKRKRGKRKNEKLNFAKPLETHRTGKQKQNMKQALTSDTPGQKKVDGLYLAIKQQSAKIYRSSSATRRVDRLSMLEVILQLWLVQDDPLIVLQCWK